MNVNGQTVMGNCAYAITCNAPVFNQIYVCTGWYWLLLVMMWQ